MLPVAKTTWNSTLKSFAFDQTSTSSFVLFRSKVAQRDIPGIDASYLAMDTEEGVEVVWNEVLFSERKISDFQHVRETTCFHLDDIGSAQTHSRIKSVMFSTN